MEHSHNNKPEIPGQTVWYKQEFVISEQFPMRYCSTWLRPLLCYIKKFVIVEFVIRVLHCIHIQPLARVGGTRGYSSLFVCKSYVHSTLALHSMVDNGI